MIWAITYAAIVLSAIVAATLVFRSSREPLYGWIAIIVIIPCTAFAIEITTRFHYWEIREVSRENLHTRYTHWLRRDTIDFNSIEFIEGDGQISTTGTLTASRKKHGRWSTEIIKLKPLRTSESVEFFWYGEPITEGEWHLRNPPTSFYVN
jgi:hypothetical protein